METLNLLMNNKTEALQKMNMLYTSSHIARRFDAQIYEKGIPDEIEVDEDAINRNVEIFNVYLKACGLGFNMVDE